MSTSQQQQRRPTAMPAPAPVPAVAPAAVPPTATARVVDVESVRDGLRERTGRTTTSHLVMRRTLDDPVYGRLLLGVCGPDGVQRVIEVWMQQAPNGGWMGSRPRAGQQQQQQQEVSVHVFAPPDVTIVRAELLERSRA